MINNPNYSELLLLIEVRNCLSARFKDLYFIRDVITYRQVKMCNLLKILTFLSLVSETERTLVLKELKI